MKGIVIAAGRGSRMGALTADRPKCMLPLAGRSLLARTVENLRTAGCSEVVVVVGYGADRIDVPDIVRVENPDFEANNILHSLMYAREHLYGGALVSYSDIWVEPWIHGRLLESRDDIALAVDRDWESYYVDRDGHPISEAEIARYDADRRLVAIGKNLEPVPRGHGHGEFLGLWRLTEMGARCFVERFEELDARLNPDEPFGRAKAWRNAYVTDLFQELIDSDQPVGCTLIDRGWAELDTREDYERLESVAGSQRLWTLYPESARNAQQRAYRRAMAARVLGAANDLKRTTDALAVDLGIPAERVHAVVAGEADASSAELLLREIGRRYPVTPDEVTVTPDDSDDGAVVMTANESRASSRVFTRPDRTGALSPYYEYRDTAMSRTAPFKPEWIQELRCVDDADPDNPDIAYNRGHLLHQTTFFIGEVNFYWEIDGRRHCAELNTGDSNYITPFVPHSFASRNPDRPGLILAVTYAGAVGRVHDEFSRIGGSAVDELAGDLRDPRAAFVRKLERQLAAESLSASDFEQRLVHRGIERERAQSLIAHGGAHAIEIATMAAALHVRPADLAVCRLSAEEEVVVVRRGDRTSRPHPGNDQPVYRISELSRTCHQPGLKGLDFEVLGCEGGRLRHGLVEYVYNYGATPVELIWRGQRRRVLAPGDSALLRPMVEHQFARCADEGPGRLLVVRVPGLLTDTALDEYAAYSPQSRRRVCEESTRWY